MNINKTIARPNYLNKLIQYKDKDLVKIVTGIRRCGKSTMLNQFKQYLVDNGINSNNIIHMNMESIRFIELLDYRKFYNYVQERIIENEKNYLIFDELQVVDKWEKAIESFRIEYDVDIYITGSNAYLLSNEFSTVLSGRYVEIQMYPLSFMEYLDFNYFNSGETMEDKFQAYLKYGGMPILRELDFNEDRVNEVLEGVYSSVIIRDVMDRYKINDKVLLNKLALFLADNIGNITSPNKISNTLYNEGKINDKNAKASNKTIDSYIQMLTSAFIFYPANRYDIKGRELLKTLNKYYIIDLGFRNLLLGYRDGDRGHILENIVYFELLRRGYRVYIGKVDNLEIDFIAEKASEKKYVKVTESMSSDEVRERELKPLKLINDNHEKILLSMDKTYLNSVDGIKVINIVDFLLSE